MDVLTCTATTGWRWSGRPAAAPSGCTSTLKAAGAPGRKSKPGADTVGCSTAAAAAAAAAALKRSERSDPACAPRPGLARPVPRRRDARCRYAAKGGSCHARRRIQITARLHGGWHHVPVHHEAPLISPLPVHSSPRRFPPRPQAGAGAEGEENVEMKGNKEYESAMGRMLLWGIL